MLSQLPPELLVEILDYLDPTDMIHLNQVAVLFWNIEGTRYWKTQCLRLYFKEKAKTKRKIPWAIPIHHELISSLNLLGPRGLSISSTGVITPR